MRLWCGALIVRLPKVCKRKNARFDKKMTWVAGSLGKQGFLFRNKWLNGWAAFFLLQYGAGFHCLVKHVVSQEGSPRKSSQVFSIYQQAREYYYECIDCVCYPPHEI
ncbi:conserved hypothetical protein [Agrobacterium fabrum str. J-07]|nr:conserved hypothetical protein [Agrobacterium fabrum str. J-07]